MMKKYQAIFVMLLTLHKLATASYVHEKKLHRKLLTDYNLDVRPETSFHAPVEVEFDFVLEEVNEFDVKKQVLDVSAFITLEWNDPQLKWNASEFGGIDEIIMSPKLIWTPDIVLYNTGEEKPPSKHTEIYKTKINVESNGEVIWVAPTNWKISCSCNIKWFPADAQVCSLNFGSWSYNYRRLKLQLDPRIRVKEHILGSYNGVSSGGWAVENLTATVINTTFRCCRNPFSTVSITLSLHRMPLYYLLYALLPLVALILMMALIFHLDIGQRASYGMTILLSISVFLLVLSDNLPETSDHLPWVGVTFIAEYIFLCLTIPLAEYTAHIAQRSHSPPPAFFGSICASYSMITGKPEEMKRLHSIQLQTAEGKELVDQHELFNKQWRVVGKFLDISLSTLFIISVVAIPVIIAAIIA